MFIKTKNILYDVKTSKQNILEHDIFSAYWDLMLDLFFFNGNNLYTTM